MQHLQQIRRLAARVRWRLRLQTGTQRLVVAGAVGLAVVAVAAVLVKTQLLEVARFGPIAIGAAGLAGLAFVSGLLRRVDDIEAAARLDAAGGLHDRLGSALAFSREASPTAFQRAAIEDAAKVVTLASPKLAAPWLVPAYLGWLAVSGLSLGGAVAMTWTVGEDEGRALRPLTMAPMAARARPQLVEEDKERLEEEAEKLAEVLAVTSDPRAKGFLAELNDLIRALQEGKLSAREAHAKMAALDKARQEWAEEVGEGFEETAAQVSRAAEQQLGKRRGDKPLDGALQALREQAWKDAARELERLAERVEAKGREPMSDKERKALAREMEQLSRSLESERQREQERLKKDQSRLKKKEQRLGDRLSPRDRSRLDKNRRELERLEREQAAQSEARRTLERLQRETGRSAEQLSQRGQGMDAQTAEAMRKAAEMLRRMAEQQQGRQQMRAAEGRMVDIKEMLRRAGQQGEDGQGGEDGPGGKMKRFEQVAKGGQDGPEGKSGGQKAGQKGQSGSQGQDGGACEEGGGQDPITMLSEGKGKGGDMLLLGPGAAPGGRPGGARPASGGDGGDGEQPGSGVGTGHDPRVLGDKTDNDVKTKDGFVAGREGAGASQSRVVFTAAKKGFATRQWREVHQDYSGVVEERLEEQRIPAGQRQYVRRYFDLIRPR